MRKISLLGQSALGSVALFGAFAFASPAYAQPQVGAPEAVIPPDEAEEEEEATPTDANGQPADGGTITVTGSRIRLPNIESYEPIVTVDEQFIEDRNLTNVADALNELPGFRGSVTPSGAQGSFGQGVNFVNQYGLGSNRTLTLVNGRRFVSSNVPTIFNQGSAGTQVDLNVIPVALIDRVDTVGVGGAPVYGSDAISGTVNVILRTRFEGLEVNALSGITEEGDNFRYSVSGVLGINFANGRGNVVLSASRDVVEGVVYNQRGFLREGIGGATNPSTAQANTLRPGGPGFASDGRLNTGIGFNDSSTDTFPGGVLVRGVTIPFLSNGGVITGTNLALTNPINPAVVLGRPFNPNALQFDGNGNLVAFNQGALFPGTSSAGGDGFRFQDYSQITSDLERNIFNMFLNYDLTDDITFFSEATYFRSRADELTQQPTFNSSLFGGTSAALSFSSTNPFLTDQARAQLANRGITTFSISRNSDDLADLTGFAENELYRIVAGLRGEFNLGNRVFNWEFSGNYGETDITDFGQDINAQNFINAVNVTRNAAGQIVCTTAPTVGTTGFAAPGGTPVADPNCVPLNLFGRGLSSQAARDYVIEDRTVRSELVQTVFNANVGGTLFNLWGAGDAGINIGYEYRKEEASFEPDEFTRQGRGRSVAIAPVQGQYELNEFFGEVIVPLISPEMNLGFLHSADVFARGRYVDNTVNGGFFSWAAGGTLAPVEDVQFRGNYTRSFRSPAVTELFFPLSPSFSFVGDPCTPAARNSGPAAATRLANCNAFLAAFPNATPLDAATASVPSISGGNPNLENEVAESWSVGVIVRPRWIPRLSLTADWINIDIFNPIAQLTVAQIIAGCFDNPNFNASDPANGNAFCSRIRRFPAGTRDANGRDIGGQVDSTLANPGVSFGFVNGNKIEFRGLQGTLNYTLPMDFAGLSGNFDLGVDALYVDKRLVDLTTVAPLESQGLLGDPQFSANIRLRYSEDLWGVSSSINFVGNQAASRTDRNNRDVREFDEYDSYAIVNAGVFFNVDENFRLNLSVTNLFNYQGQEYFGTLIPATYVDLLGRRYAVSARVRF